MLNQLFCVWIFHVIQGQLVHAVPSVFDTCKGCEHNGTYQFYNFRSKYNDTENACREMAEGHISHFGYLYKNKDIFYKENLFFSDNICSYKDKSNELTGNSTQTGNTPVYIHVSPSYIGLVLVRIINSFNWTNIIVFVDKKQEYLHISSALLREISPLSVSYNIFEFSQWYQTKEMKDIVSQAVSTAYPCIVIASLETITKILKLADIFNFRNSHHRWLIYTTDENIDACLQFIFPYDNIAVIHKNYWIQKSLSEIVVRVTANFVTDFVNDSCTKCTDQCEKLPDKVTLYACDLDHEIVAVIVDYPEKTDLHNLSAALFHVSTAVAMSPSKVNWKLVTTTENIFHSSHNIRDIYQTPLEKFSNRILKIGTWEHSYFQRRKFHENGSYSWEGLTFNLLDLIARDLNFSYHLLEPKDGEWGIKQGNGNWSGMIGMVINKLFHAGTNLCGGDGGMTGLNQILVSIIIILKDPITIITQKLTLHVTKEIDFAAGDFSVTADREKVVDFASPYYHDQSVVVFKKPKENRALLFLKPFKWHVWLCLWITIFFLGPLLWLVTIKSPVYECYPKHRQASKELFKLDSAVLCVVKAYFTQGSTFTPFSQAGRFLFGFMWFAVVVIVGTYTGNLISGFTVTTISMPFNTLQEMVSQNEYTWGSVKGVALTMLFRDSTFEPYKRVHRRNHLVASYGDGIKHIESGKFAFITDKSWYLEASRHSCDVVIMKEEFFPTSYAWAFPTDSPLKDIVSKKINKLTESGIIAKWVSDWIPSNSTCSNGPVTQSHAINMADMTGLVYIWSAGITFSLMFFIIEICLAKCLQKYKVFRACNHGSDL